MIAAAVVSLGPWAWVILGIVLIGVEVMAPGVFFIWLGLAAIATGLLAAAIGLSWQIAALTFAVLALLAVILGRWLMRASAPHDTQAATLNRRGEGLVGREFVLETPIEGGSGRIRVDDSSWRVTGRDRSAGQRVRVVRVEGTTLVVDDV
ncbi:NfeD family protein [Microvirga antarctica]|uniref:NfeD family protein n=1 Tax=Microvirga antarctica TaxID=2819233 RepID=UPI001B316966|nr:NfeD family protein [Microvirga antarctica]